MKRVKTTCVALLIAGAGTLTAASGASAECLIEGGGRSGTVQNNDFVSFGHDMGNAGKGKRYFTDAGWAGQSLTVEPKNQCLVVMFGPKGHMPVKKRTEVGSDMLAISCECPK